MDISKHFIFSPIPTEILFGVGVSEKIGEVCYKLGASKPLLVTDQGLVDAGVADNLMQALRDSNMEVELFPEVVPNSSTDVVDLGLNRYKQSGCDLLIGVGGGSSLDTAKAIGLLAANPGPLTDYEGLGHVRNPLPPVIAVPTTAGTGSEVTIWSVVTDAKRRAKIGIGSIYLAPTYAVCDPNLSLSLPPSVTATTGMDALCHALESYVNTATQPISESLALRAIELIGQNLRTAVTNGKDVPARSALLLASTMAALAFNSTRLGIVHALAMPLGSDDLQIPHGLANAIMLPYVMEFNLIGNLPKFRDIARALGEQVEGLSIREAALRSVHAVRSLAEDIGIPGKLSSVGVRESHLRHVAMEAMKSGNIAVNPRQPQTDDIERICRKAI